MSKPFICSACDQRFTSVVNFDRHRTGKFTNEHPHYGRRCLSEAEIEPLGLRKDEQHRWYDPKQRAAS